MKSTKTNKKIFRISQNIVVTTIFLDAFFLILVMAVLAFIYMDRLEADLPFGIEILFLVFLGVIALFMVVVALILTKKIDELFAPIDDIVSAIEEIKKGNYDIQISLQENNELKVIGDAVNQMSQEISKQVQLVYECFAFDSLTGLKNFKTSAQEIDDTLFKQNDKIALCLIEINNLKSIGVTKGQMVVEELMQNFADKISACIGNNDHIYSHSPNEIVFLIQGFRSLERVETSVTKLLDLFNSPIDIKNFKVEVHLNIGISIYPSDGKDVATLIKKCDTALFKARESGLGKYAFYNEQLTRDVNYRQQISEQLALAVKNQQLYLKYQPLIDNKNEIYGFEALVRWKSPTFGEISPQVFVANAEESHLIVPIGNWILREACQAQVELKKRFDKQFVISINVSPVQLLQKDFILNLRDIIRETEIDPNCLALEITEGVLIDSSIYLEEVIDYLHKIGAKIALDDFGTGYASLTYLKQIPFDNLKIDKTFVDGIFGPKKDHAIIAMIIQLAHSLDIKVVAEGVEKRRQYEYLKQIATDIFQGYLFSKPLTFDEAAHYVDQFYKVAKSKRIDVFAGSDFQE
ncbi:MAG: EAL domain-containing protein [Acholeplasmataceae bacterium]|nr:EAL domain-containing protein [Acholeplasmataceae bacterium]